MTMKFKVIGAPHVERGKQIGVNESGAPIYSEATYARGEVVETDIDLAKRFNPKGSPAMAKFTRLADSSKATHKENSRFNAEKSEDAVEEETEDEEFVAEEEEESEDDIDEEGGIGNDTLSSMTVAELRLHAGSEGIDLHGAHTKADILARIRGN